MYEIGKLTTLHLGRKGERNARTIQINVTPWREKWPTAAISLIVIRPGEEEEDAYIASTIWDELEGQAVLTWIPNAADLAIAGIGRAEVRAVVTEEGDVEVIKKSVMVKTGIAPAINEGSEPPPEPMPGWISEMSAMINTAAGIGTEAIEAAEAAEQSASEAAASAAAAAASATAAGNSATAAAGSASAARESAATASQNAIVTISKATEAADSAVAAAAAQTAAEAAQTAAETAETNAIGYADTANTYASSAADSAGDAQTAAGAAGDAQLAAEAAQTAAETAQSDAETAAQAAQNAQTAAEDAQALAETAQSAAETAATEAADSAADAAQSAQDAEDAAAAAAASNAVLLINAGTVSSLPATVTNSAIEDDMVCVNAELGTPQAQKGNWTVTTGNGTLTVTGTISGSTTLRLHLMKARTS